MTDLRTAAQMALDAIESVFEGDDKGADHWTVNGGTYEAVDCMNAMRALRTALAQGEQEIESDRPHVEDDGCPTEKAVLQRFWREHQTQGEQEPVVWALQEPFERRIGTMPVSFKRHDEFGFVVPLYTAPPQREWQRLTFDEIKEACAAIPNEALDMYEVARAIEAKLRAKNHG